MKKTILAVILISTVAIVSCSKKNEVYRQLEQVDSVLFCNFPDSAKSLLRGITPESAADSAYYNILKTQTDYMFCATAYDFKDIDFSINYYKKHYDPQKLSNAYYYKAMIDVDHDSLTQQTVMLLKEAEKLADETADNNLKNKICSALSYSNGYLENHNEALKYAKKEYFYAKKLNNNRDVAYGMLRLSTVYERCGMPDSSKYYINECNNLVQYIKNDDKAFVYCLLGESYMASNIDSAQKYFVASLKYKKSSMAYQYLMEIYFTQNDRATAMRYCDSALMMAWNKQKIAIYSQLAQKYYDSNDMENLKTVTDKISDTYKEILLEDRNKFILEMQRKFDFEKQKIEYSKNVSLCISAIAIICAICAVLYLLYKHEKQVAMQKNLEWENHNLQLLGDLREAKHTIASYELHIKSLESETSTPIESSNNQEYINSKKNITEVLEIGGNIYHKIENNESIINDKDFWVHCIFYCMYSDTSKAKDALSHYRNLSTDEKIFVVVDESFNKKDNDIADILCISPVTVRTRRSKLKAKLV